MNRRLFLSAALLGMTRKAGRNITGGFVFEDFKEGHRLRQRTSEFRSPRETAKVPVVIVGGGIAGLSAAWRLDKRGFRDFVLLEMAPQAGGNSRWGENEISRYPWAAHYIPVPNKEAALVRELLEEFGALRDGKFDERMLCFAPQERLFLHGRWQEGLEPEIAATQRDHEQYRRFAAKIQEFRETRQFTIPIETGARPSPLDRMPFAEWLRDNGFDSPYLLWYADYACRDDYGAMASATSAWAGIHYFASREPEEKGPLAWPEGNGWILRHLLAKLGRYARTGATVYRIRQQGRKAVVFTETTEYEADAVIFAAPAFLAEHILEDAPPVRGTVYSPWLTANLTLERLPAERGTEPAWDNVIYDSLALGYVDATHMSLRSRAGPSVWTFYQAFAQGDPHAERQRLLSEDWNYWSNAVLDDLERAHRDIRDCVSRIDIFRIGHAMARPVPGFLASEERRRLAGKPHGAVYFANSDLSGISIFEEAQYRGVTAADRVLRKLGGRSPVA